MRWALFAFTLLQFAMTPVWGEAGLTTSFADVRISNVPLGKPTTVRDAGGQDFRIQNTGERAVRIQVEVLAPAPSDLRDQALIIPDPHWIRVEPNLVDLQPKQSATCSVIITVPGEKRFAKKTYQVMIWSHTRPASDGGMMIGAGLLSRLRFTTRRK